LNARVSDPVSNTASVLAVLEVDEAALAPALAPGVTDEPVALIGVVPDELHAVIDIIVAAGATIAEDTRAVILPRLSIDAHGQGTSGNESNLEIGFVLTLARILAARDGIAVVSELHLNFGLVELAVAAAARITRSVGVVTVELLAASGHQILVGSVGGATIAARILSVAIDDLLGRKFHELVSGEESHRFDSFSDGECPARAALALILDGSDGLLGAPIECGRQIRIAEIDRLRIGSNRKIRRADGQILRLEFSSGEIRKFVHCKGGLRVAGRQSGDTLEGGLEIAEASRLLLIRAVDAAELVLP